MDLFLNVNIQFYIATYLIAGIPFGLLLAKFFANVDIKQSGSKSIGATNVLRVVKESDPILAKKLGAATLALDALKGVVVILVAKYMGMDSDVLWAIALIAVLAHCFSPYLMFEGGKGVATGMGVLMVMMPIETTIALIVWAISAKTIKISSISSLLGLLAAVVASLVLQPEIAHAPIVLIAVIIVYKHIPNLIRLFTGEESRVTA